MKKSRKSVKIIRDSIRDSIRSKYACGGGNATVVEFIQKERIPAVKFSKEDV
jgi:hypothetical protein